VLGQKVSMQTNASRHDDEQAKAQPGPPVVADASSVPAKKTAALPPQLQSEMPARFHAFQGMWSHQGRCNICGRQTSFFYTDEVLYRESLVCGECLTTSRYRSIARGILKAIRELKGIEAESIAELDPENENLNLRIYDTQIPFHFDTCAYPIPELLSRCKWIEVQASRFKPKEPLGINLGPNITNQNLEALTFGDNAFDILITSDVMEHVRLDHQAHGEIRRVLKPGGVYLFTVPHFRDRRETFYRVAVVDPSDPTKDLYLTEKEFHGDANSAEGSALSYRSYGTEIEEELSALGFTVEYTRDDFPEAGIYNTELFFCRLSK
jgi:SAM-dependent methyltransferase